MITATPLSAKRRKARAAIGGLAALSLMGLAACSSSNTGSPFVPAPPQAAPVIYAVNANNQLLSFSPSTPGTVTTIGTLALDMGEQVVGLDRRDIRADITTNVENRDALYAFTSEGRMLLVDRETAMFEAVGSLEPICPAGVMECDPEDARFDIDFNPAANALRFVGDAGTNLRVGGAALDTGMDIPTNIDGLFGIRQGVRGVAYTNTDQNSGSLGTVMWVIDTQNQMLWAQNPNEGVIPSNLMGAPASRQLGLLVTAVGGYTIFQGAPTGVEPALVPAANEHYAVLRVMDGGMSTTGLYRVNPAAVAPDPVLELIAPVPDDVKGLAVREGAEMGVDTERRITLLRDMGGMDVLDRRVLALVDDTLSDENLQSLDGLPMGTRLLDIDQRTTTAMGQTPNLGLFGVTRVTDSGAGAVVRIAEDGVVTPVGNLTNQSPGGMGAAITFAADEQVAIDFNPRPDLLRIVTSNARNLRVNLDADRTPPACIGGMAAVQPQGGVCLDRTIRIADPGIQAVAVAYRPLNAGQAPDLTQFQYLINAGDSKLYVVVVPNDGALVEVGLLGVTLPENAMGAAQQSMDIVRFNNSDIAYAALRPMGMAQSALYAVNLSTGAATLVGPIGGMSAAPISAITTYVE